MQIIARNSRRLRRLVDTLLEFGRLGAGKLVATPIAVDLAAMTRGIAESFGPAVQRAGLEFVVECPPELSLRWGKIISRGGRAACTRRHRTPRTGARARALPTSRRVAVAVSPELPTDTG
jgi:signal transduction histidine kinase